jgi:hypothetical protein
MAWLRYVLYFLGIALVTAAITQLEVAFPGALRLQVFTYEGDVLGTSEYSVVELVQVLILVICGALMWWVSQHLQAQRPLAALFGGMSLIFLVRELHWYLDTYVVDNLWQVLVGIPGAFLIVYTYRHRRRMQIALARIWPSPGLTLIYAGAIVMFAYSLLIGHEPLWQAIMGDSYVRVVKLAVEEFIELIAYFLWLIGTIEYAYQAKQIAGREPVAAAAKRRETRRRHL